MMQDGQADGQMGALQVSLAEADSASKAELAALRNQITEERSRVVAAAAHHDALLLEVPACHA